MIGLGAAGLLAIPGLCLAQAAKDSQLINTADLDKEIRQFLAREMAAHVEAIKSLDPPPDRVVGALTTGEFSWGTFMRTLAAYSDLDRTRTVAGRDVIPMIAKIGPIELRQGGKTWAQLYAALALQHLGTDVNHNALWQSLAPAALRLGRYDRYSNEYARAIYDAAVTAGRADIMKAVAPSLKEQMRLWWDLLAPDGYGYSWGRSLGAISYMDTLEISAFLASYPEFRPAPLVQLASAYYAAWRWLRSDFNDQTQLLSVFAFGRGDYSYITKEREWQQTTAFLGKLINAHVALIAILEREGVAGVSPPPALPPLSLFLFFHRSARRRFRGCALTPVVY